MASTEGPSCAGGTVLRIGDGCRAGRPLVSNLGGLGPDAGSKEEVRYAAVGSASNGALFDLVITATTPWYRPVLSINDAGCEGLLGNIVIQSGTHVGLRFQFEDSVTGLPVTLPKFAFTIYDLDDDGEEQKLWQ